MWNIRQNKNIVSIVDRDFIHQIQPSCSQSQNYKHTHKHKKLVKAQNHLQAAPQTQRQSILEVLTC